MAVYQQNKQVEDGLKQAAAEEAKKNQEAEDAAAKEVTEESKNEGDNKKKQAAKKKKGKEMPTQIQFGKGTRALLDFLYVLEMEAGGQ